MADNYGQWFITKMFTDAEAAVISSGKQITFKKMIASQDIFTQDDLATLTNSVLGTIDIKQQVNISTVLPSTGSYKVQGVFSNSTVTADYLMNTILLVGSYNGAEFLAAAQVANNAFKMPAASTGEQTIYTIAAQISVSNTATVSLTVDPDSIVTNAGLKVVTDAQAVKDSAQNAEISDLEAKDSQNVKVTENQTIDGAKTFTQQITGSISGNAGSANKFTTPRKIDGVEFDGTQDLELNVVHRTGNETIAGTKIFQDPVNVKDLKATGNVSLGKPRQSPWATSYFSNGQLNLTRIGSLVFVMGWANTNSIPAGTTPANPFPDGFKPNASLGAVRLVTTEGHKYEIGTDGKLTFRTAVPSGGSFTPVTAPFITADDFPT